ncbi:MAG TPA: transcriptional repressor NrdR, partial [Candidatus Alectryocaccomicrobium excrementavium]|nr:transcriptional repressor NrdR [Candidatus Alectryocaccomicrobium excrementavium]
MKCRYCNSMESRVVDSRQTEDGTAIRRRRECEKCGRRFTTYEKIDVAPLMVIKKDQKRQCFDVEKIRTGLIKACEKRPISLEQIDELVRSVEMEVYNRFDPEVSSQAIGE